MSSLSFHSGDTTKASEGEIACRVEHDARVESLAIFAPALCSFPSAIPEPATARSLTVGSRFVWPTVSQESRVKIEQTRGMNFYSK